jgi:hypothetical protein
MSCKYTYKNIFFNSKEDILDFLSKNVIVKKQLSPPASPPTIPPTQDVNVVLNPNAIGFKILQPEYYLTQSVVSVADAKANMERKNALLRSVKNLNELPTKVRIHTYPHKEVNKNEELYGKKFQKLGGGQLFQIVHTSEEGVETIIYEFRSLKHGFGLSKGFVQELFPRIIPFLPEKSLLETTDTNGYSNKQFFPDGFENFYSLYDVWNVMNETERADFLHKLNIRREQMVEAFDTQNVFDAILKQERQQYELSRVLGNYRTANRGNTVASYGVDFKTEVSVETLPHSMYIDAQTGNQHQVVVLADFDRLYDGEGVLKTGEEYKSAMKKIVDGLRVIVDSATGQEKDRISDAIIDQLAAQLNGDGFDSVHFLNSGYNLVISDTSGKPYIKPLFPTTDLKSNDALNKNLYELVQNSKYNQKSTRTQGFHILLKNLSEKVGTKVYVKNVNFNFYTTDKKVNMYTLAVSLEWVKDGKKHNKTIHVPVEDNNEAAGRYEKNVSDIQKKLAKQVEELFEVSDVSVSFVASELKEPHDVATILKNNNQVELGVFWDPRYDDGNPKSDFRSGTPVLFSEDRIVPKLISEEQTSKRATDAVTLPTISTPVEIPEVSPVTIIPTTSGVSPIQEQVNSFIGKEGILLQKDLKDRHNNVVQIFGVDIDKLMESSEDAKSRVLTALGKEDRASQFKSLKNQLSYLYFNSKFEHLKPLFTTDNKKVESDCVIK